MSERGSLDADNAPRNAPWWRKKRPGKIESSMAALSAAAIVSVYAVGYVSSSGVEATGTSLAAAAVPTTVPATPTAAATTATAVATSRAGAVATPRVTAPPAATATPVAAAAVGYKDGTYTGTGSSRHGSIEATVVVQGGKIVSAEVSTCGTRYPCSRISALPARVLAAQSTSVNYVSGATDSSVAYLSAVKAALQKAQA